jgi:hypothetical protein
MLRDDMSSPFLSHMCDDDFDEETKEVEIQKDLKCCVWNCKNSSGKGRCFEFGGLVICAPCYMFLTTGMRANSQLERNTFALLKKDVAETLDLLYKKDD